ncbi:methyl-accepting chemotaxis protein [Cohnella algarum]|uniref:methyl-accepting chemotaxis protein n=1 Tax=Cohnella algarum TaxID=2044859 RepID=UPI001966FC58|nr:methyl-accepting chemotaxis protein [Cohnella algarum]MBN2984043.1 hypothetical protein [Cohnella algarum]
MQDKKNRLMLQLAFAAAAINAAIFIFAQTMDPFRHGTGHGEATAAPGPAGGQYALLIVSMLVLGWGVFLFLRNRDHRLLPLVITLSLTFSSISMISGSGGGVEFHFSIFMVIAAVAYFENIKLVSLMTALFAVQHVWGFFFAPRLVFGTDSYPFLMLVVHAGFLILTSSATMLQIRSKQTITAQLEEEKRRHEESRSRLIRQVEGLSDHIRASSEIVTGKSDSNVRINREMMAAFEEVIGGLGNQILSVEQIETSLDTINRSIQNAIDSSEEMRRNAAATEEAAAESHEKVVRLQAQNEEVLRSMAEIFESMNALKQSVVRAQSMIGLIQEVAEQTNLLALNATIEAARAGEHGRGFNVVADEIRKLSDQSRRAADEIQDMLTSVQDESRFNFSLVERGQAAVRQSSAFIMEFADDFREIRQLIERLRQFISTVYETITAVNNGSSAVTGEMNQIASVIEQGISAMDELSAKSDILIQAAMEVDHEIKRLNGLSQELQKQFEP